MLTVILSVLSSGAFIASVGFIYQLGTRVTAIEAKDPLLKELMEEKFDEIARRLDRIELAMNGRLPHAD
jgi:hypothetical protein